MPKSSKRFILSNSGLNSYGFRLLTEGADLSDFNSNPIMLWMHNRAFRGTNDEVLPLGYWDDIKIEGDEISAVPFFDDNDEYAMKIYHKVENGTLRTCSSGAIPIETSEDPKHLLPGQTYATVSKWKLKEASITDIGANPGALAVALYDQEENLITLSDKSIDTIIPAINLTNMKFIQLSAPEVAAKLGLGTEPTPQEVIAAIDSMVQLNANLNTEKQTLETSNTALTAELETVKKAAAGQKIATLVDGAIAERKISPSSKEHFVKLAEADFESVEKLLNEMPSAPSVQATVQAGLKSGIVELADKSWDELHKSGQLETLKLNDPASYARIYKEKFGKELKA